jgi:hypothetical protein
LDTFRVTLTVTDSALRQDSETKEYVYDHYPSCVPTGGGGGPAIPEIAEKYSEPAGEIKVIGVTASDEGTCECECGIEVVRVRHVALNEFSEEDLNFVVRLRAQIQEIEQKKKEIEEKAKELVDLVHDPEEDIKLELLKSKEK